jgi:hypothetical protein
MRVETRAKYVSKTQIAPRSLRIWRAIISEKLLTSVPVQKLLSKTDLSLSKILHTLFPRGIGPDGWTASLAHSKI